MYPLEMLVSRGDKAKKLATGSMIVFDEKNIEYFAIYDLVEKMKSKFNNLLLGNELYIIYQREIWTGTKWNNKQVNNIVFIAHDLETINAYLTLIKEKEETKIKKLNKWQEYMEFIESSIVRRKKYHEKLIAKLKNSEVLNPHFIVFDFHNKLSLDEKLKSDFNQFEVLETQTRNQYDNDIETLTNRLIEIHDKIELMKT